MTMINRINMELTYYVRFVVRLQRPVHCMLLIVLLYFSYFSVQPVSTLSFSSLDAFNALHTEAIQVEISEHNLPGTKEKRSSVLYPEKIKLQLRSKRFSPTILLEIKEDWRSWLPSHHRNNIVVNENNNGSELHQTYIGKDYDATALLTNENGQLHLMMEFFIDGNQFFVVTQCDPSRSNEIRHTLLEPRNPPTLGNDYISEDEAKISGTEHERLKRNTSPGTTVNTIELLIFIDYSLYTFWNEHVSTNVSNREQHLRKTIEEYYEFMGTAADQRYQNIIDKDLNIRVKVVGIIIADSKDKSPWTEQYKEQATSGNRSYLDASIALPAFADYIKTNRSLLTGHDHAVLITAYDLHLNGTLATAGFAFLSTLCGDRSVSIIEDHFDFVSLTVMAHEIGHSLGATHDGIGNNNCNGSEGYIMSNINSPTTGPMAYNPWIFSTCSRAEFRIFLQMLDLKSNCLKRIDASKSTNYTYVLPGTQYTADEQCIIMRNEKDSYMCRTLYQNFDYSTICTGMFCRKSRFQQCEISLPADGTPCGPQKWCINGICVQSESVPSSCIHGDQMNEVLSYGKVCSTLVTQSPWLCYQNHVWQVCCESCQSIYTGVKGCEYGDKNDCQLIKKNPFGCYNITTASNACCRTCEELKKPNSPVGCEYGDKVSNCYNITSVNISVCNDSGVMSECCETCYTGKVKRFVGTLRINRDYKATFQDTTSPDFKNLEQELTKELNSACNNGSLRNFCKYSKLLNTCSGSILAVTELGYLSDVNVTEQSVTSSLAQALLQSTTSIAQAINTTSIAFNQLEEPTTIAPTTKLSTAKDAATQKSTNPPQSTLGAGNQGEGANRNGSLPDWVIPVAAGVGGALLLGIVIAVCCCCCCKRQKQRPENARHINAYPNKGYSYADWGNPAVKRQTGNNIHDVSDRKQKRDGHSGHKRKDYNYSFDSGNYQPYYAPKSTSSKQHESHFNQHGRRRDKHGNDPFYNVGKNSPMYW